MKILLGTDGSEASREAQWLLARIPFPEPIDLTIAHVVLVPSLALMRHEFPSSVNKVLDQYHEQAERLLAEEAVHFEGIDGTVTTCVRSGHPADELLHLATESHSDLVVLGARGLSASRRLLLGSVSMRVAKHASCSVLITRPMKREPADRRLRILVACEGSESSRHAVQELARIHWGEQIEIDVLNIVPFVPPSEMGFDPKMEAFWKDEYRRAEEVVDWAVHELLPATPHVGGEARRGVGFVDEIIDGIDRFDADLVVGGDRGLSRIERFFLGSTSENVLRHAPCSVWIIRGDGSEAR